MDDKTREKNGENLIETLENLNEVVEIAGGCGYTLEKIKELSFLEFLIHVAAPNGVRFINKKKKKRIRRKKKQYQMIFFGNQSASGECYRTHKLLEDAFSYMSALQQPAHSFNEEEAKLAVIQQGKCKIDLEVITRKIVHALGQEDLLK